MGTRNARLCPPGWFDNWMNNHIVQGFHDSVDRSYFPNQKSQQLALFCVVFFLNVANCYPVTNHSTSPFPGGCYVRDAVIELPAKFCNHDRIPWLDGRDAYTL